LVSCAEAADTPDTAEPDGDDNGADLGTDDDGEDAPAAAADGDPNVVGAISTLTGPFTFPESTQAVQAVFDQVNADGGINGRPLEYVVEDDGFDPATASQAARRLVESAGIVALVGSASGLDCAVNSTFYADAGVYAIQGTGVDPLCFRSSNISPVNTGPFLGGTVSLYYASEELGHDNVCYAAFDIPDWQDAYTEAVAEWTRLTGNELTYSDTNLPLDGDLTPFLLAAENNGCDAAVVQANDFHYVSMMNIKQQQDLELQILGLTSGYTEEVAEELGDVGDGFVVNAEFEPFTDLDSPVLQEWRDLMDAAGVPATSFAQGGYLAATIFVDVLRTIEGEITRDSVGEALLQLDTYDTDLIGNPYAFGDAEAHNPNRSSKFVELEGGEWVVRTDDWITLDD
jgi:branched-chain amino acid transport system substrate-binding protein